MILQTLRSLAACRRAGLAGWVGLTWGLAAASGQPTEIEAASEVATRTTTSDRNVLIDRAIESLQRPRGLAAKVRLRGELFHQHLLGSGTYQQWNVDDSQLLKVDLKLAFHEKVATFQRVNDGRSIWTRTDLPREDGQWESHVERLDLMQWRRAPSHLETPAIPWGDLAHLLAQLQTTFSFDRPQSMTHHGSPAWLLGGQRREPLAEQGSQSSPNEVVVVLGKQDLFPYLVEFRRREAADLEGERSPFLVSGAARTLLAIDFFEVAFPDAMARDTFQFRAGEIPVRELSP